MKKEEVIKKAWGEYYELIKDELDEHGRYNYYDCISEVRKRKMWQFENIEMHQISNLNLLIPSSIQGIENNNGWIKLKGLSKEIPIEEEAIELYNIDTKEYYISTDTHEYIEIGKYTHWKPINKSNPPIY